MTEKYKNKKEAEAAAKEYAWGKMGQGYNCNRVDSCYNFIVYSYHREFSLRPGVKKFIFAPQQGWPRSSNNSK
jgi:hypothetical protein